MTISGCYLQQDCCGVKPISKPGAIAIQCHAINELAESGPCESLSFHYKARDACLAKSASADGTMNVDAASLANAVALACTAETEKLIEVMNRDGDPSVAARIQKDSEFRAMGCVMKARLEAKRKAGMGYHGDTALMPGNLSLMGAAEGVE